MTFFLLNILLENNMKNQVPKIDNDLTLCMQSGQNENTHEELDTHIGWDGS